MSDRSSPQFVISVQKEGTTTYLRVGAGLEVDVAITALAFEDSENAHKLAFEIDNWDLSEFDSATFVEGDKIQFSYGYDGDMTPPSEAVVVESFGGHKGGKGGKGKGSKELSTSASHGKAEGGVKLKIEAIGKEYLMNKVTKTRTFEGKKRSDVARLLAQENGYGPADQDIEDSQVLLSQITQHGLTDHQLLRDMASKESCEFFIDATGFHFHKRKLGQAPLKTLTYYTDGDGEIISFTIKASGAAKPGAVTAVGLDLHNGKKIEARGDDKSTAGRPTLASVLEVVDVPTGATHLETRRATEVTVCSTATNAQDAQKQANGAYQKTQTESVTVNIHCVGNPLLKAKSVVELRGIGAKFVGKYYVSKATHRIGTSGYTTDLECKRDGTNGQAGTLGKTPPAGSGAQNKQGQAGADDLVPIEVVDAKNGVTRLEWRKK